MQGKGVPFFVIAVAFGLAGAAGCQDEASQDETTSTDPSTDDTGSTTDPSTTDSESQSASSSDTSEATDSDTGSGSDVGTDSEEPFTCDREGLTPTSAMAGQSSFHLEYAAYEFDGSQSRELRVQIYSGDFGGPTKPGTYSLEGLNYMDCGLCVLAYDNCTMLECDRSFFARSGTVEITAIGTTGDQFAATLHDVVLEEVTIDPTTFESTPVAGGQTWCAGGYSFDETIDPYVTARCADPWLTCMGDTMKDFELENCGTEEMVSMSELAAGQKALWFVLVTGWCTTCAAYVPMVVEKDDQYADQGLEVVYVLGENQFMGAPTAAYCRSYAGQYTDSSRFYVDHNGSYSFATMFENLWPYIGDDGVFSVPWNAAIDAETFEYVYGDGVNLDSDIDAYIDELLGL